MLDLATARDYARAARRIGVHQIAVTPDWLEQAIAEIEAGRQAAARHGETFSRRGRSL